MHRVAASDVLCDLRVLAVDARSETAEAVTQLPAERVARARDLEYTDDVPLRRENDRSIWLPRRRVAVDELAHAGRLHVAERLYHFELVADVPEVGLVGIRLDGPVARVAVYVVEIASQVRGGGTVVVPVTMREVVFVVVIVTELRAVAVTDRLDYEASGAETAHVIAAENGVRVTADAAAKAEAARDVEVEYVPRLVLPLARQFGDVAARSDEHAVVLAGFWIEREAVEPVVVVRVGDGRVLALLAAECASSDAVLSEERGAAAEADEGGGGVAHDALCTAAITVFFREMFWKDFMVRRRIMRMTHHDTTEPVSPSAVALAAFQPVPPPVMPPTNIMEVLGIEKVAPWMRDVIDEAEASGDAYRVCAAVGTIARLWTPRDGGLHPQSLASLLSDGRNPVTRCRAWFTALPAKVIEHVHAIGSYSADGIHDHCFKIATSGTRDELRALIIDRDDAESVSWMLRWTRFGNNLAGYLGSVDRRLPIESFRRIAPDGFPADDRIGAVSWQEPEAWWGTFTR